MQSTLKAYALSIGALTGAILLRWVLDPVMGDTLPLVTIFGAVAASVWIGGIWPAAGVAVLGYLACSFLFMEPRGNVELVRAGTLVGLVAYLFTCTLIIIFGEQARRAHSRANERREILQVTLRSIGDAVVTTDNAGRVTYLNTVAETLTGWSLADAHGKPLERIFRIVNEDTREPVENPAMRALKEGMVVGLANHTMLIRRDGSECPISDSAAPITNERGQVSGCILVFRDVTEQRRLEQDKAAQLRTARVLAAIVETSEDAIVSKTLDGTIQSWNDAAERMFGYSASEAVGRHISLVIPPDRISEEDDIIASLRAERRIEHFETERVRRDGRRIKVSLSISPIKDADGNVVGASKIVRDITLQREAESDRQKFVTLVESSTDFIGMSDLEGVPFFVNRAGLRMVGLDSIEEASKVAVADFFFPEDQEMIMGEFFPSVLRNGHGEIEVRFRNFRTGEARWMAYKVLALTDEEGNPTAFATVSQDVSRRREMEERLRKYAADLSDAARRKDEFLAILAHELRNPLAPISNAVQVLRMRGDKPGADYAIDMLQRQVGQLARLVDDLLDVSRITRGKIELRRERVDLGRSLYQSVEASSALYRSLNHNVTITLPPGPVFVNADPTRLAQVFGNLLNNACKFTDRGGHIAVSVDVEDKRAIVRVRDTGIGIVPENLPGLFQMFSQIDTSLERSRDGLGIGLTLVKSLVEMHGGSVEVHSEGLGRGSEFVVRLPVAEELPPSLRHSLDKHDSGDSGRRILIIDDNADGAESLAMLLQLNAHQARTAGDGAEGLQLGETFRPDVVLLDIGLPKMSGYEVCRLIRERDWGRDVMLVALTGWGQEEDRQKSKDAGFDAHMVKPVDHDALLALLNDLRPAST